MYVNTQMTDEERCFAAFVLVMTEELKIITVSLWMCVVQCLSIFYFQLNSLFFNATCTDSVYWQISDQLTYVVDPIYRCNWYLWKLKNEVY